MHQASLKLRCNIECIVYDGNIWSELYVALRSSYASYYTDCLPRLEKESSETAQWVKNWLVTFTSSTKTLSKSYLHRTDTEFTLIMINGCTANEGLCFERTMILKFTLTLSQCSPNGGARRIGAAVEDCR